MHLSLQKPQKAHQMTAAGVVDVLVPTTVAEVAKVVAAAHVHIAAKIPVKVLAPVLVAVDAVV